MFNAVALHQMPRLRGTTLGDILCRCSPQKLLLDFEWMAANPVDARELPQVREFNNAD
jgi:hypothetical protein